MDNDIFVIANAHWEEHVFEIPFLEHGKRWLRVVDTLLSSPYDVLEEGNEEFLKNQDSYTAGPRTVIALIEK